MEDIAMDQEEVGRRTILKKREVLCMTRSDSMSIGSIGSDLVSGGSEEMDTEDSEKDPKEGFIQSERTRFLSQERQQKGLDNLTLPLDNQRESKYDLERITGDVTSPVIENKLSDDVNGYYAMRTSLLSQSAVILENGGAVGKTSSGRYEDANCNIGTHGSGTRSSCEARKSSKPFHTGYSSDSESEPEGLSCSMQSTDEKHNESYSNSKQESNISSAAEIRVKIEPESDVDEPQDDQGEEHERKDFTSSIEVKTKSYPEGGCDAEHTETLRKVSVDIQDGNASDSMAEIEKSGLEAKLARVSKRRIYSRARDLAQASDSSSESDSESDSEEEEEKEMIFEDLHSAKVLFNVGQPDSEKLIEREALKMACMDDLLSDCSSGDSSEDSSDDSSDSSSAESSDSDESSDSELSSADESDDEAEEEEGEKRPHKGKQTLASKDGLDRGLPEVEYLKISLPPSVELIKVGHVSSIIGSLVIIQAEPDKPALNMETVLFKPDRSVLGQVYELFGPVVSPFYSVRFNNASDIEQHGIKLKTDVFFAPKNVDVTQYVFTEQLKKMRGSDASWKNDEECPDEVQDFSDDEAESLAKNSKKRERKRKVPQGRNDGFQNGHGQWRHGNRQEQFHGQRSQPRSHPPLQRQPACRPPQFGSPSFGPRHHQQHQQFMPRYSNPPGWMPTNIGPSRGDVPRPPRQWHRAPPPRPPGFPPGVPPMFQNPQTTEPPMSLQPPAQPSLQQLMQQQGFSARKMDGSVPLKQSASVPDPQMGVLPPWQLKPPLPPPSWGGAPLPVRTPLMNSSAATSQQSSRTATTNAFTNPPSNQPVPPSLGFSLFSIPPPPLTLPPPPPPGVPPKGDHAQKPPPLMDQQVHPVASLHLSAPSQMQQWFQAQSLQGQTLFTPKMGAPAAAALVSTSNFAPPPVPPPSFHPRMMQSFRQNPKTPNPQGASHS